ncbi:MAG: glycosyl hydrolase, partial [Gemmatimonadetes bacterium]|nr:glycosyl hydrolase [Gemmatimonadota bacterium]
MRGAADGGAAALTDSAVVAGVKVRSIGPAVMSGRVVDIAVASSPGARGGQLGTVVYVAAASGGVWKSINAGVSWTSVFDNYGTASIGAVAVAPSNSDIVWVGTGEANNQRSSSYGDGVYKSTDGGKTFHLMGLKTSQQVGRIVVDPTNPDIVFVAAGGPLWAGGGERGIYRTTDGGKTWKAVLTGNEWTGATDLVLDP